MTLDIGQSTTVLSNNARLKFSRPNYLLLNLLIKKPLFKNVKLKFGRSRLGSTNCMRSLGIWVLSYRNKGKCLVRNLPPQVRFFGQSGFFVLDNIENNVSSIAVDTSGAAQELTTAHEYQRKAGRRAACLGVVLIIVVVVVLLAVRAALWILHHYPL